MLLSPNSKEFKGNSVFGDWIMKYGLPTFNYKANPLTTPECEWEPLPYPKTRQNFHFIGNKAVSFLVDNYGGTGMWDELECSRWLTKPDHIDGGTGLSRIEEADGTTWGTYIKEAPEGMTPERHFGPMFYSVHPEHKGLRLDREMILPEGDHPWAFVRVTVSLDKNQIARTVKLSEEWALRPYYAAAMVLPEERREIADEVSYEVSLGNQVIAQEIFGDDDFGGETGEPAKMMIESFNPGFDATTDGEQQPTITMTGEVTLQPGESKEFYFRFGRFEEGTIDKPESFFDDTLAAAIERLPAGSCDDLPYTSAELVWNASSIYGMVFKDNIIGDYTINQGCAYAFTIGINAAPRDPLQYVTAMAYMEPKLALECLRNTLGWGSEDGDLPFTLGSDKEPSLMAFRPSDQGLWSLWAACEYYALTGDLKAFGEDQYYHPFHDQESISLKENLIRQFRFFIDEVGRGTGGHPRIWNADWQDDVLDFAGAYDKEAMIAEGGSVFNSALAAYVLPMFAGLMTKLGEDDIAAEARKEAAELRALVAKSHNGKYFARATVPNGDIVGDDICWIEVQAFALLCGAAEDAGMVDTVLQYVDDFNAKDSPLGARTMFPHTGKGRASRGGVWYTINEKLIAGAAKFGRKDWAARHLEMMSLHNKTLAYPDRFNGVLSGPDAWNAPESTLNPGESWEGWNPENKGGGADGEVIPEQQNGGSVEKLDEALVQMAMYASMQSFPIANTHSHTNPILGLLHYGGVFVNEDCELEVGTGIEFEAPHWKLNKDGSGWIMTDQEITVHSPNGTFTGTGKVEF
ncbi:GH36-type glycosyl hydrolase domain-containing protein [Photobacterium sp. OFAV2-7]|uniref:GH36-type glycosyl hydrolase domain-containing protein n=1 Tax=Photobacterium sp. OFAV2-7 TaxID=2917748 RepID=UPI001EF61291|nr:hypothetical protein [Photobacterium sp. OFAV2-7]MCG7584346.1 hypothetical protein [Photobacterium sp. OFAV2-7]